MAESKPLTESYHTSMQGGKKAQIEMPPVQPEQVPEVVEAQEQNNEEIEAENLQQETQVSEVKEEVKPETETTQAKNFRQLKEKAQKLESERNEALRIAQELQSKLNPQPKVEEEVDYRINPDDLVEGKHLNKFEKKIKKLEDTLKNYQQQSTESTIEVKLKNQFPDFDKVVSRENVELLKEAYPELANTLNSSSDLYSKAVSAYTLIKKFGIHQEEPYKADIERAKTNAAKPKPLASIAPQQGDTPLSRANAFAQGLTDDLRKQLHKEMLDAMKNR